MLATAVCARIGAATVAAHQIAFQLFGFLALVLDAIAIAGQVIVGRALGAGDADEAFAAARRMIELSLAAGLVIGGVFLALADVIPRAFTSDPDVIDQAQDLWPLFCAHVAGGRRRLRARRDPHRRGRHALPGRGDGRRPSSSSCRSC